MLANNAKKPAYEKHSLSRILGNKKLVFSPLHKDDVPSRSINHEETVALFWVQKKWKCNTVSDGEGNRPEGQMRYIQHAVSPDPP